MQHVDAIYHALRRSDVDVSVRHASLIVVADMIKVPRVATAYSIICSWTRFLILLTRLQFIPNHPSLTSTSGLSCLVSLLNDEQVANA